MPLRRILAQKLCNLGRGSTWPRRTRTNTDQGVCETGTPSTWSVGSGYEWQSRTRMSTAQGHCPRRLRSSFQKSFADNILSRKLLALKTLLARWERVLKRQACFEDKEYRKALRLRQLQQRKDKEKQRRLEALNQKRIREEERLRREVVRKRMKSSDFMDDIPWV